ncbi:MAG: isoprenylcysteine carboxylmethyltransferase family protein [Spirochaetaceae bacterium]|nr:isoprenylcysteine carboxylmethyltransferase family protein [Spirochaetaceae bacterium]
MKIIGKPTINPFFFYSGKISSYLTWVYLILSLVNCFDLSIVSLPIAKNAAFVILLSGLLFSILSMFNLGKSTSLGLPEEKTVLKKSGLYKISRNPMYIGFNLLTISSIIYTGNLYILLLGLYSIIIYHLIIVNEEKFLESRFGAEYSEYKAEVRRYL